MDAATTWIHATDNLLARIHKGVKAGRYLPKNEKAILDFITYLRAQGSKPATIWRHAYSWEKLLNAFDYKVEILKADKTQVINAMAKVELLKVNAETKAKIKSTLKFVFKTLVGEGEYYPKAVGWIRTTTKKDNKLTPSDLLTDDEQQRMIEAANTARAKAIIALLCDAPIRPHELIALKRKHLYLDADPAFLIIPPDTKTGTRRIPLFGSVTILATYFNMDKNLKPEDPLFLDESVDSEKKKPISYAAFTKIIKKAAKRAKITKRVWGYVFRHSVITRYSSKISNAQLEKISGWTYGNTQMHRIYQHLDDTSTDDEMSRANGIEVNGDRSKPKARFKICPRCRVSNSLDSIYCAKCGGALDIKLGVAQSIAGELVATLIKDQDKLEDLAKQQMKIEAMARKAIKAKR